MVCYCTVLQHSTTNSSLLIPHPESLYNNGKGIQVSISLIGLPPKTGEKWHMNAKPPVTTKVMYIHKKTTFVKGLTQIIVYTFNKEDLCRGSWIAMAIWKRKPQICSPSHTPSHACSWKMSKFYQKMTGRCSWRRLGRSPLHREN